MRHRSSHDQTISDQDCIPLEVQRHVCTWRNTCATLALFDSPGKVTPTAMLATDCTSSDLSLRGEGTDDLTAGKGGGVELQRQSSHNLILTSFDALLWAAQRRRCPAGSQTVAPHILNSRGHSGHFSSPCIPIGYLIFRSTSLPRTQYALMCLSVWVGLPICQTRS